MPPKAGSVTTQTIAAIIGGLSLLLQSGCASVASRGIGVGRTEINNAIQNTDSEQLLLNIVRQRYNDPVMFLDVASVSDSFSRSSNLNISSFLSSRLDPQSFAASLGGSASGSPLIFYSPNTGERFVRQFLSPLDLRTISLMLQSGWSIERVLLVDGESINGISNAAGGETPYAAIAGHLRTLQRESLLSFAVETGTNGEALAIIFKPGAVSHASYVEVCRLLGVIADGRRLQIRLGIGNGAASGDTIFLATRSLHAAFYFLSSGVSAPGDDERSETIPARRLDTNRFNAATGGLFKVLTTRSEPSGAAVKVHYRGDWFYIPETDADTRTTFSMISMMLMLQTGDSARMSPLVSLSPR